MRKTMGKKLVTMMTVAMLITGAFTGCGQKESEEIDNVSFESTEGVDIDAKIDVEEEEGEESSSGKTSGAAQEVASELSVQFGDNGQAFMMQLEQNETAQTIARYVGTSDWRLPIYEDDATADYDVLQYYDIPSHYEIPSNPETVTEVKAGEVYYSDPNRIVLFYHDAEVSQEYTKVGNFDATQEFVTAVEENPVLEGWGNKIVLITQP